jgi:hypothetical protein
MNSLLISLGGYYVVLRVQKKGTVLLAPIDRCCQQQINRREKHKIKKSFTLWKTSLILKMFQIEPRISTRVIYCSGIALAYSLLSNLYTAEVYC